MKKKFISANWQPLKTKPEKKTSDWLQSAVLAALFTSLISNGVQLWQYNVLNRRADMEAQRADDLQKKKDDWADNLRFELKETDQRIASLRTTLRAEDLARPAIGEPANPAVAERTRLEAAELASREQERSLLQKLLNTLMTSYK